MGNQSLKSLALACKTLAIVVSVVVPMLLGHRWGVNRIADFQLVGLAVLSLIPNRWLVFSRITFVIFLPLMLFPFRVFFHLSAFKAVDLGLEFSNPYGSVSVRSVATVSCFEPHSLSAWG
jgi:hypothetical protein